MYSTSNPMRCEPVAYEIVVNLSSGTNISRFTKLLVAAYFILQDDFCNSLHSILELHLYIYYLLDPIPTVQRSIGTCTWIT